MRNIPYEEQTLDHPNPVARYAHRARVRLALSEARRILPTGGTLVDYGAGQGRFLHLLREELVASGRGRERLIGYDPFMAPVFPGLERVHAVEEISAGSVDCVTVLEVCEHLDERETDALIEAVRRMVKRNGFVLVTVPIVIGPVILVKEIVRMLLFRRWTDLTIKELALCAVLGRVPRRADNIKHSHRGYDWRVTRRLLEDRLGRVETVSFSPFSVLGSWLNSQVMFVVRLR